MTPGRRPSAAHPSLRRRDWLARGTTSWSDRTSPAFRAPKGLPERPSVSKRGAAELTTVYIKNIPCSFDRYALVDFLDACGFAGLYDFVHLPMDFDSKASMGYAFVNFCDGCAAEAFRSQLDGFARWPGQRSSKVLQVVWSRVQGFEKNAKIARYAKLPARFKPLTFPRSAAAPHFERGRAHVRLQ